MDLNDVFDRFWRKLTKKDSVDSAKYEITIFLPVLSVFGHFFPWIRIFRIVSGFLSDPDPDSGKQVPSGSGKKPGSETLKSSGAVHMVLWSMAP